MSGEPRRACCCIHCWYPISGYEHSVGVVLVPADAPEDGSILGFVHEGCAEVFAERMRDRPALTNAQVRMVGVA